MWQLDSAWSRALRDVLSAWLGAPLDRTCGTDADSQRRYRDNLARTGFDVAAASVDYSGELSLEQVIGGVFSALPVDRLPRPEHRPDLAERIRRALEPHRPFVEDVHVAIVLGRVS